jgi:large subunit ribosomal protein L19
MSSIIDSIERSQLKENLPSFAAGDRVRVHFQVIEGNRRRTQVFEGVVLKRQGSGARETFTVRKQSFGVGVERTFPLHSPKIERLEVAARGDVRRAKLYYLRGRIGKRARVSERRWGIDEEVFASPPEEVDAIDAEGVSQEEAEVVETPEGGDGVEQAEAGEGEAEAELEAQAPAEAEESQAEPEEADDSDEAEPEGEKDES